MSAWSELLSCALVGTERRAFVPDPSMPSADDPAQALLRQAMLAAVPDLAGAPPSAYDGPLPEPAPADNRPLLPRAAELRMRAVLDVYPKYLAEWLGAVHASGYRLPSAAMPALLEAGRNNVALRSALAHVLGARGHWLAGQNADWRYLLREPFGPLRPEDWDGPDPDAQIAYANGLYATDPSAARALLRAAWPNLTAASRMQLLALVTRHGTRDDLPFVRGLSQDSSKQVREEAGRVVTQLERRESQSPELSADEFRTELERLIELDGIANSVYHFATQRAGRRWPIDGARVLLAALLEISRGNGKQHWAAHQLIGMLADCAPLELLPDAERVARAQAAEIAAGAEHWLDFGNLLTPLGFRAEMHAELTASPDAATGQE